MPITFTFHPDHDLIVDRYWGRVTDDEYLSAYRTVFADPRYEPHLNALADLRETEDLDLSGETMCQLVEMTKSHLGEMTETSNTAIVTAGPLQYGISRMYDAYTDIAVAGRVEGFESLHDALAWLGVTGLPLDQLHAKS